MVPSPVIPPGPRSRRPAQPVLPWNTAPAAERCGRRPRSEEGDTIAEVIAQIDLTTEKVDAAITGLAELDPASQDVAIAIRQVLDKDRWFLSAHLSVK